ncbi:hypothetical protein [Nitrosopumilus adriaticus]|uniref:Uncharacterized protein n=1 Tax=Nitrosopumilus adriaticus TaxID=1580092 RepID=A0A0D5C2L5_9ARCH|nr:hypothetical protein [Nitrosopumilus adriaticus]AJW71044.1 hypothetical protein NADRNF5_1358 [Nitrosopumilus adriaticus]
MKELDKKTNALNQSGAFLQFHVLNELTKKHWETTVEKPVSAAPFLTHPEKQSLIYAHLLADRTIPADHFAKAMSDSQLLSMKQETSVDIDATKVIPIEFDPTIVFRLCVEVKKNDPRYSDWCFFQLKQNTEPMRVISKNIRRDGRIELFNISKTDRHGDPIFVQTNQYPHWSIFKHDISDFALALQNEQIKPEYFRSEKTKVDETARQIIKGTYGCILDDIIKQVSSGNGYSNSPNIYIPIIVTNANLYLCKFDLEDIDTSMGHITKDPKYEKVDSIIYEHPTPKEVQFPQPLSSRLDEYSREQIAKWHVLILSPKGFTEFLENLDKIKSMI